MNEYQTLMYTQLMDLVANNEAFYFQDFNLDGTTYRIFNYRLASYTEFQKPGAIECRGHMFEVAKGPFGEIPVRFAALPMPKFFNLNENPFTMGLDLAQVDTIELKADGSLMSTYTHNNQLRLKSKGSLFSEQAIDAMKWLETAPQLNQRLRLLDDAGWTVNMEWCAPHNRIVIGYETAHLKVLNARHRETGNYLSRDTLEDVCGRHNVIDRVDTKGLDVAAFVQSIPGMQDDIEGYVARIGDLWFKVKTERYLSLHHAKDSVNNPRRLFEAILDEDVDDLRSMFYTDAVAMKMIDDMQDRVDHLYNHMVKVVEAFYDANKHLERKDYALKGQAELDRLYFGLAMTKYLEKPVEYKKFLKSKYKEFGIRDTQQETVGE